MATLILNIERSEINRDLKHFAILSDGRICQFDYCSDSLSEYHSDHFKFFEFKFQILVHNKIFVETGSQDLFLHLYDMILSNQVEDFAYEMFNETDNVIEENNITINFVVNDTVFTNVKIFKTEILINLFNENND